MNKFFERTGRILTALVAIFVLAACAAAGEQQPTATPVSSIENLPLPTDSVDEVVAVIVTPTPAEGEAAEATEQPTAEGEATEETAAPAGEATEQPAADETGTTEPTGEAAEGMAEPTGEATEQPATTDEAAEGTAESTGEATEGTAEPTGEATEQPTATDEAPEGTAEPTGEATERQAAEGEEAEPTAEPTAEATEQPSEGGEMAAANEEELINQGEQIYASQCAKCHQLNGRGMGNAFPALRGNEMVVAEDPSAAIATVLQGPKSMPSFQDILSEQEIAAVVSYIRNAWNNDASLVSVEQVQQAQDVAEAEGETSQGE